MGEPDFAGFLQKKGGKLIASNQTRYFELRGMTLYWYKAKPSPGDEAQGACDLTGTRIDDNPKERFSWTVSGGSLSKVYTLFAMTEADKQTWMSKLANPNAGSASGGVKTKGNGDSDDEGGAGGTQMVFGTAGKKVTTDDFEVKTVIGKGAFGKVMLVEKKDTKEVFAMKEMDKEVIERENLLEHTFAEKSILQKINHPFIVKLHYAFQTSDRLYLVLDFLAGGELFFHLGQVGRFDEWRAKFYTAEIGLAIGYLHSLDIIYRDLKPENCVLDKDGYVCVTDFGLAKTNVQGATAETFCGTPEYLAPEFLIGGGHGKAVDWWSLGILLYEMLCGIPPFYDENVTDMYDLILKKPLEFDDAVSPAARDLLTKLLDRDPSKRMQSVEAFKAHPFFSDMDFNALYARKIPAPFKPDQKATNNFGTEFTSLKARLSTKGSSKEHSHIGGFTYNGESAMPQ